MVVTPLLLALLLARSSPDGADRLVAKLGAADPAEREAATAALERLGDEARPALTVAVGSDDPEVRVRAERVLGRIEEQAIGRPTMVALDFEDRPLAEVVAALADRTGFRLGLAPGGEASWHRRPITVREPAPVPFWRAVDRIAEAGDVRLDRFLAADLNTPAPNPVLRFLGGRGRPGPVVDDGPIRIKLVGLHYHHDLPLDQPPSLAPLPARRTGQQFFATLEITAEPRMILVQPAGPPGDLPRPTVVEAADDRDQSLVPEPGAVGVPSSMSLQGTRATLTLHLRRPEGPGAAIKVLRATAPLTIVARRSAPLVVPLADAEGRSFRQGDQVVTVQKIQVSTVPNQSTLTLEISGPPASNPSPNPRDWLHARFEVVDADGKVLPWMNRSALTGGETQSLVMTLRPAPRLVLQPPEPTGPPAQLRLYKLITVRRDVAFEFRDLPMP